VNCIFPLSYWETERVNRLLSPALVFPSECLCLLCMKEWAVMAHVPLSAQLFSFSSLASSLSILPSQSFTAEAWSLHSLGGLQGLVRKREADLFLESCERVSIWSKVIKQEIPDNLIIICAQWSSHSLWASIVLWTLFWRG